MKNFLWEFIGFTGIICLFLLLESPMNVNAADTHMVADNKVTLQHFVELELESIRFDVLEEGDMPYITIRNTSENDATGFTAILIVTLGTSQVIHTSVNSNLNAAAGRGVILPLGIRADSVSDGGYTLYISVSYEEASWMWERRFQVEDGVWSEEERREPGPPESLFWVILVLLIVVAIIANRIRNKSSESNGL